MKRLILFMIMMSLFGRLVCAGMSEIEMAKSRARMAKEAETRKAEEKRQKDSEDALRKQEEKERSDNLARVHEQTAILINKAQAAKTEREKIASAEDIIKLMNNSEYFEAKDFGQIKNAVTKDQAIRKSLEDHVRQSSKTMPTEVLRNWLSLLHEVSDEGLVNDLAKQYLSAATSTKILLDYIRALAFLKENFLPNRLQALLNSIPDFQKRLSILVSALGQYSFSEIREIFKTLDKIADKEILLNIKLQLLDTKSSKSELKKAIPEDRIFLINALKDIHEAGIKGADDMAYVILANMESIQDDSTKHALLNLMKPWNLSSPRWAAFKRWFLGMPQFTYDPVYRNQTSEQISKEFFNGQEKELPFQTSAEAFLENFDFFYNKYKLIDELYRASGFKYDIKSTLDWFIEEARKRYAKGLLDKWEYVSLDKRNMILGHIAAEPRMLDVFYRLFLNSEARTTFSKNVVSYFLAINKAKNIPDAIFTEMIKNITAGQYIGWYLKGPNNPLLDNMTPKQFNDFMKRWDSLIDPEEFRTAQFKSMVPDFLSIQLNKNRKKTIIVKLIELIKAVRGVARETYDALHTLKVALVKIDPAMFSELQKASRFRPSIFQNWQQDNGFWKEDFTTFTADAEFLNGLPEAQFDAFLVAWQTLAPISAKAFTNAAKSLKSITNAKQKIALFRVLQKNSNISSVDYSQALRDALNDPILLEEGFADRDFAMLATELLAEPERTKLMTAWAQKEKDISLDEFNKLVTDLNSKLPQDKNMKAQLLDRLDGYLAYFKSAKVKVPDQKKLDVIENLLQTFKKSA